MTQREFLNAGYTLLVDEWRALGVGLLGALEQQAEFREGGGETPAEQTPAGGKTPPPPPKNLAAQNEAALGQLGEMLKNVSMKGPRV